MHAVDEDGITQAPGPLRLVQRFLNTHDVARGVDELEKAASFAAWAQDAGMALDAEPSPREIARAVAIREALRDVLAARDDGTANAPAAAELHDAIRRFDIRPVVTPAGGLELRHAASGADRVSAEVVTRALAAMSTDGWSRLKVCHNDACRWAFYDGSRNRSGRWCSARICGSVVNARAYRARRRAVAPSPGSS